MVNRTNVPTQRSNSAATDDGGTRKQFAEQIKNYSERPKESHVFSGEHYKPLAQFLEHVPPVHGWRRVTEQDTGFLPLYLHINKAGQEKTQVVAYDAVDNLRSNATLCPPDSQTSHLIILRGWQPREWIRTLGAHCKIDPEFFRRHLEFIDSSSYFDLPALPSSSRNLWRLRVTTICTKQSPLNVDEVRKQRDGDMDGVQNYMNTMRANERIGSSIVRKHAVISETTSIIEQDVSFCVQKRKSGGWTGLIWLDNGRPFDTSRVIPWLDRAKVKFGFYDPYVPIVQHKAKAVLNPPDPDAFEMTQMGQAGNNASTQGPTQASQSACNLPEQYGISLNKDLMRIDALYTFSELFTLALSSENQFLTMIQAEIMAAVKTFQGQEEACIDTLSYCKALLDDHADRLQETIHFLENEEENGWPRASEQADVEIRDRVVKGLLKDYGTNFVRNYAMLQASEKSIYQAKEVSRISLLAYFFLPMSFVTSFFGMNFLQIKDWKKAIISATFVFVGVMGVSTVICFWDFMPWRRVRKAANSPPQ
ncbi:hypothetical protein K469DRAFT_260224 [Zopfia rhizophila CBS 207.26]|uniref:Cora-domain-containing protein n=1 Tax=Zopfia rhizophila CBS 207.26 TaxID=1314779 RepID=A0A6A6DT45_9PEZI|nr:hypothetical protein K469DRAFT_260224 [Zopfia rhizophila CBS 207.26]